MISPTFSKMPVGKKHEVDFNWALNSVRSQRPFSFVRFSDGEIEILRNRRLEISADGVNWYKGKNQFVYPLYDYKSFDPERDVELRERVLASATFRDPSYIKGIPTRHNKSIKDRDLMIGLNGGLDNLTFSDLLVNANYRRFLQEFVPLLQRISNLYVISNFRTRLEHINNQWQLLPLPDDAFNSFSTLVTEIVEILEQAPEHCFVLSSASSLSNIIGHEIRRKRPDITFIDIGTAMHPIFGLEDAKRDYQSQLLPWNTKTLKRKITYQLSTSSRFAW
jgi:hypothetical protein